MEDWARKQFGPLLDPLISAAARANFSPNALTVVGFGLNALAGLLIALGWPFWGGVVMAGLAMPLDALDGGIARKLGRQSTFGAFLDSTLDRFAEGVLLAGLGYAFALRGDALAVAGTFLALVGSFMVSYTRARAEGLGLVCRVGIFSRLGRFLLLADLAGCAGGDGLGAGCPVYIYCLGAHCVCLSRHRRALDETLDLGAGLERIHPFSQRFGL
jgi:CDP-diacylglycerol--glycerol-3-phosphate 3-phosphatidyltransferase